MILAVAAYIVLSSLTQPGNSFNKASKSFAQPQEKTFKVQSQSFKLNGMYLQFQYRVKEDIYDKNPTERVLIMDKKLVDINRHVIVLDFPMLSEDINPTIDLSLIDKAIYSPEDFDDVNFDGYKDIREQCIPCSGSLGNVEEIYLFNNHTKTFISWQSDMNINVEIDPLNKMVKSFQGPLSNGGQFQYKEIKFIGNGTQLYKKDIECTFLNEEKRMFKVVYNKYMGEKLVVHKTRIFTKEENIDAFGIIEQIQK